METSSSMLTANSTYTHQSGAPAPAASAGVLLGEGRRERLCAAIAASVSVPGGWTRTGKDAEEDGGHD